MLIGALVTFLVVILYSTYQPAADDGRAKQICRVVVIILGVISLLKYIGYFRALVQRKAPASQPGLLQCAKGRRRSPHVVNQSSTSFRTWSLAKRVALLQLALELLAAALDHIQVVVVSLPHFSFAEPLTASVAFDPVPIHRRLPLS